MDWDLVLESIGPIALGAVRATIPLTLASFAIGLVLAVGLALMRISGVALLSGIARLYISLIRGTPLLVQAEKEGQIESKMMRARQMEEIREARRVEALSMPGSGKGCSVVKRTQAPGPNRRQSPYFAATGSVPTTPATNQSMCPMAASSSAPWV